MAAARVRVMKFGGTSVGSPDRLLRVVEIVAGALAEGPVAVVVSAMQHTTDRLVEAADLASRGDRDGAERVIDEVADLTIANGLLTLQRIEQQHGAPARKPEVTPRVRGMLAELRQLLYGVSLLRECTAQTRDLVLSFGERLSATVVSELLAARGLPGLYVDARDWVVTNDHFGAADIVPPLTCARLSALQPAWEGRVPVVTGFLGATADGRSTTLGRNGSDYTATLLARCLDAAEVVIWTDVSGVMTADPALVADAYPLSRLSYMEALELVDFGATMFHPRTMIPLIESGIPMRIRNTMQPADPGTLVDASGSRDETAATSVTSLEEAALLGVQVRRIAKGSALGGRVLRALEQAGLTIHLATQSAQGQAVAAVVPRTEVDRALAALRETLELELQRGDVEEPTVLQPVTIVTLVAEAMGQTVNVAGRFFHALGAVGINIRAVAQGASSRSISAVIDGADTALAVRTVHAAFNFAHQEVSLLVLGKGTVGAQLLAQVRDGHEGLERDHDVKLKVVGIQTTRGTLFDDRGLDLAGWNERLAAAEQAGEHLDLPELLDRLRRLPVPVLVDCTAADGMERVYEEAIGRGIHVVAANKKPLTVPWEDRERLVNAARKHHRFYHYETTVGASLPVIDTLKNLVRTGDRVLLIEGSFSGTLGYVVNEVSAGVPLSEAVRRAREMGYTEPNPAEDLSGMDVARKALILARELGLRLEVSDLKVEPLVDTGLPAGATVEQFFEALQARDAEVAARVAALAVEGKVWRYLARIDPSAEARGERVCKVGPVAVAADHPARHLKGTEAFVAFTTDRYRQYPLLVQGAGAGGPVTAAGVLADVLKISLTLRGR
jgi:bifunctional aspartokinase / homoserine dehydrogenase 1